jgi:hypothetical protein
MTVADFPDSPPNRELTERANRLRQAVRAGGGNQIVSQRSGVHLRNLSRYLAGEEMKVSSLVALSEATNVCLDWLATGRGEMHYVPRSPTGPPQGRERRVAYPQGAAPPIARTSPPGMDETAAAAPVPASNRLNITALAKAIEIVQAVAGHNAFRDTPTAVAERIATTYAVLTRPDLDNSPPLPEA